MREFAVFSINQSEPFFVPNIQLVIDLMHNWQVRDAEIEILRELPSLRELEAAFWVELGRLRFTESVQAIESGTLLGTVPLVLSEESREDYGSLANDPPMTLMRVEGAAAVIEMLSEGIVMMMDYSIAYSRLVLRNSKFRGSPLYFRSEREMNPLLGFMATWTEFIGGVSHPLRDENPPLLLWIGTQHDLWDELEGFRQQITQKIGIQATAMASQS